MTNIRNTKTYGIAESIFASGYPMLDSPPTEEEFEKEVDIIRKDIDNFTNIENINNKHIKRMISLGNTRAGSGHGQALIGCIVQFDLEIPIKVWTEAQRYHFLDFVSSMSTMHKIKDFELTHNTMDKHVDQRIIDILNEKQKQYNDNPTKENMLELLMNTPVGLNICARMTTNYSQLKTMYNQRLNHKIPIWHTFCDWCDELPLFNLLTGCTRRRGD